MTPYKQSFVVVMSNGKHVLWTGLAIDKEAGKKAAMKHAIQRQQCAVYDIASRPVFSKPSRT